jgi:hypothetical protein
MPSNWETFPIEFKGGLISNLNPLQQGRNKVGSATILQNFEPSKNGGYKKVLGYTKFISAALSGTGNVLGVRVISSSEVIAIRKNGGNVSQYYLGSGSTWTSLGSAASLGGRVKHEDYNFTGVDKVMFVDGVNSPAVYNDSSNTLSFPSLPAELTGAEHLTEYKNALFLSKGPNLYFSAPFSDTDFSAASGGGVINVGHQITGLFVFRDQLIIFSRTKIQRLVGSTIADFQLVPIAGNIGCLYGETIQEVGGDVMFMAADGLRLLSATERIGDFGLGVASAPISKDAISFINSTTIFSSIVLREKAQYRVFAFSESVPAASAKGLIATKFADQGSDEIHWATLSGFRAYCAHGLYVVGQELTVFANSDGYVYKLEFGSSRDGAAIEAVFKSPYMPINDPQLRKTFYKLALYTETSGTLSVAVNLDFDLFKIDNYTGGLANTINISSEASGIFLYGSPNSLYGTATYGSALDNVLNTNVIGSGKTVSLRIEDETTNPTFSLDTAVLEYRVNERK